MVLTKFCQYKGFITYFVKTIKTDVYPREVYRRQCELIRTQTVVLTSVCYNITAIANEAEIKWMKKSIGSITQYKVLECQGNGLQAIVFLYPQLYNKTWEAKLQQYLVNKFYMVTVKFSLAVFDFYFISVWIGESLLRLQTYRKKHQSIMFLRCVEIKLVYSCLCMCCSSIRLVLDHKSEDV